MPISAEDLSDSIGGYRFTVWVRSFLEFGKRASVKFSFLLRYSNGREKYGSGPWANHVMYFFYLQSLLGVQEVENSQYEQFEFQGVTSWVWRGGLGS